MRKSHAENGNPLKVYFEILTRALRNTCEVISAAVSLSPTLCRMNRNILRKYFSYKGLKLAGFRCEFLITSSSLRSCSLGVISCFNYVCLSFLKPKWIGVAKDTNHKKYIFTMSKIVNKPCVNTLSLHSQKVGLWKQKLQKQLMTGFLPILSLATLN